MRSKDIDFTDINVKAQIAFGILLIAFLLVILLFVRL